jgi:hypothetical protein
MTMAGMLSVGILLGTAGVSAFADGTAAAKEKSYTGTISAVDAKEKTVRVKEFLFHKTFVLGDNCVLALGENKNAPITDLRAGEKVRVSYLNASGVLVADRIDQEKLTFFGEVQSIDAANRTLTAKQGAETKTFNLAGECRILLNGSRHGALADVKPGSRVTVTYEIPGNELVARQIEQRSKVFVGKLEAFDAPNRTLKASRLLDNKKFNLADDCTIIIDGRTDARPDELKVGQKYELSYDNVDGVNVVNRIAVWESPKETSMTQKSSSTTPQSYPGYGY